MSLAVPILMYHQVSPVAQPAYRKYTVTTRAFAAQMRWLRLAGYTTLTPDALQAARLTNRPLPRRPILITFDDGYADLVTEAVPSLRAAGFTAVFYLIAGLMGQASEWLRAERGLVLPLMTWDQARALAAGGFTCGAHSLSHPRLSDLPAEACRHELAESRQRLEAQLNRPVAHLAYPFGAQNAAVRALAAECGYQTACSVQIGLSPADDDWLALRRVPVLGTDSLLDFMCRLVSAHTWRDTLNQMRGRLRPRPAPAP